MSIKLKLSFTLLFALSLCVMTSCASKEVAESSTMMNESAQNDKQSYDQLDESAPMMVVDEDENSPFNKFQNDLSGLADNCNENFSNNKIKVLLFWNKELDSHVSDWVVSALEEDSQWWSGHSIKYEKKFNQSIYKPSYRSAAFEKLETGVYNHLSCGGIEVVDLDLLKLSSHEFSESNDEIKPVDYKALEAKAIVENIDILIEFLLAFDDEGSVEFILNLKSPKTGKYLSKQVVNFDDIFEQYELKQYKWKATQNGFEKQSNVDDMTVYDVVSYVFLKEVLKQIPNVVSE